MVDELQPHSGSLSGDISISTMEWEREGGGKKGGLEGGKEEEGEGDRERRVVSGHGHTEQDGERRMGKEGTEMEECKRARERGGGKQSLLE